MAEISPKELPQTADTWIFGMRRIKTWVISEDGEPFRPYLYIVLNLDSDFILVADLKQDASPQIAEEVILSAMTNPKLGLKIRPARPARIFFEDRELSRALAPALQGLDIQAKFRHQPEILDEILAQFTDHMNEGKPPLPGLFSQKGVNPNLAGSFFSAAAAFYRAQPWVELANQDVLAVSVRPQIEPFYITVMGQGGVEYGLALHKDWADVERQFIALDNIDEMIPHGGYYAINFNQITEVPFDDLDAIELYNWEIANPEAYPVPMIYTLEDGVRRPNREQLIWYEAALRAIPIFVNQNLSRDENGQLIAVQAEIPVKTADGMKKVHIQYPGGELSAELMHARFDDFSDEFDEEEMDSNEPASFDMRRMEGDMAHMFGTPGAGKLDRMVIKAQDLMYQAWDESNPSRRIALARQALKVSADCADAYVLLAEEEAPNLQQSLDLFRLGVEAGRRALGEEYFQENVGMFWGLMETRPFMRAMEGLGQSLWRLNRVTETYEIFKEMLRLNPDDNQGIRYRMLDLLLEMQRDAELEEFLEQYPDDWSAEWAYTRALVEFRRNGAGKKANQALKEAFQENSFVPPYLLGEKRIPQRLPDSISMGADSEAVDYASHHLNYWRRVPGAVKWLASRVAKLGPLPSTDPREKSDQAMLEHARQTELEIGDTVKVNPGIADPYFGDDFSGWQGEVVDFDEDEDGAILVQIDWDRQTLEAIPEELIVRNEIEGLGWSGVFLYADQVTPSEQRDTREERAKTRKQLKRKYAWVFLGEQGQRIRAVLEDVDPGDQWAALQTWDARLRQDLKLPFTAKVLDTQPGRFRMDTKVKVTGFQPPDEDEGIMVMVEKAKKKIEMDLYNLDPLDLDAPLYELVDDYQAWFEESE